MCVSLLLALDAGGRYLNAAAANAGVLQSAGLAGFSNQHTAAATAAMMTVSRTIQVVYSLPLSLYKLPTVRPPTSHIPVQHPCHNCGLVSMCSSLCVTKFLEKPFDVREGLMKRRVKVKMLNWSKPKDS